MKQILNYSKKAFIKAFIFSFISVFSFQTMHAQVASKWTNFTIAQDKNIVHLTWSVDQQKNNQEYTIERSRDMKSWENIGYTINTTTKSNTGFSFNDANPYAGMNYYRIQQKDANGNISYSVLKVIDNGGKSMASVWASSVKSGLN